MRGGPSTGFTGLGGHDGPSQVTALPLVAALHLHLCWSSLGIPNPRSLCQERLRLGPDQVVVITWHQHTFSFNIGVHLLLHWRHCNRTLLRLILLVSRGILLLPHSGDLFHFVSVQGGHVLNVLVPMEQSI